MDPEVKGDGVYHVTYTSSEMPTFTTSPYSGEIQGYFTQELDWQNGAIDTSRSMYSIAPRPEIAPQLQYYPTYQHPTHPEIYQSQVLWTGGTANGTTAVHGTSNRRESRVGSNANGRPKRRRTQSVVQRRAANVRERRRMFQLNEAFDVLRKRLPAFNYEKRLSRIETLRLAMTYISFMQDVTTGADPKHVKLLSYQSDDSINKYDDQHNGYDSATMHEQAEMVGHEEHMTELPSLIEASQHAMVHSSAIQPVTPEPADMSVHVVPEHEHEIQSSAVHVEMLPSVPPTITLPVTNHVILTEADVEVKEHQEGEQDEDVAEEINETAQATQHLEKQCPSD